MVVAANQYGLRDLDTLVYLAVVLLQTFHRWFPWHLRIEHGKGCRRLCLQK